ncbi:MAG: Coq4 family protein [Hyphomonadaceae bacterium]
MNFNYLIKAIRYARKGRRGDAAAMKTAAFGNPAYPDVERDLAALAAPYPDIDLQPLRAEPRGTFGRAYADHMDACGLKPFHVSSEVADELGPSQILGVRYVLLHDAFHVLLDFDTSWPGELGVWSFVSAQRYSADFDRGVRLARRLYPMLAPGKKDELRAADARGQRLGEAAPRLLMAPVETMFAAPLDDVRRQLKLS